MTHCERICAGYERVVRYTNHDDAKVQAKKIRDEGRKACMVKRTETSGEGCRRHTSVWYEVWATK